MDQKQIDLTLGNEMEVHSILSILVSTAVAIVPVGKHAACSASKGPCRGGDKLEGLESLARATFIALQGQLLVNGTTACFFVKAPNSGCGGSCPTAFTCCLLRTGELLQF